MWWPPRPTSETSSPVRPSRRYRMSPRTVSSGCAARRDPRKRVAAIDAPAANVAVFRNSRLLMRRERANRLPDRAGPPEPCLDLGLGPLPADHGVEEKDREEADQDPRMDEEAADEERRV